jgi:hypothetical protein
VATIAKKRSSMAGGGEGRRARRRATYLAITELISP